MQQYGSKYFARRPQPWGCGQKVKIQLFQNTVMLHITLKGITNATTWQQIFCPQTSTHPPTLGVTSKCQLFSEHGHVAYQIKGNHKCSNMVAKIFSRQTPPLRPDPGGGAKGSKFNFFRTWSCCISN